MPLRARPAGRSRPTERSHQSGPPCDSQAEAPGLPARHHHRRQPSTSSGGKAAVSAQFPGQQDFLYRVRRPIFCTRAVPRLAREAAALARLCLAAASVLAAWPLAFVQARKRRAAPLFVCAAAPGKTAALASPHINIPANSLRNRANSPHICTRAGGSGPNPPPHPAFPYPYSIILSLSKGGLVWAPSRASIPPSSIPVCRHGAGTCPDFEKAPSTYSAPLRLYKSGGLSTSTSSHPDKLARRAGPFDYSLPPSTHSGRQG